jgi:hypothetical protein
MSRSSRLLPMPSTHGTPWWVPPLFLACGGILLAMGLTADFHKVDDMIPVMVWTCTLLAGGVVSLVERHRNKAQRQQWQRRAAAVGLTELRERVGQADLEPFLDLPLFRFGEQKHDRAGCLARGMVEGISLCVLTYRYAGWYRSRVGGKVFSGGTQTLALFQNCPLPDFHLSPVGNDWDVMESGWDRALGLGPVVQQVNPFSLDRSLLRGPDETALRRLFSPERVRQLGELTGWTIECQGGRVVVYRHREVMTVDELAPFVHRAVDFIAILTAPQEPQRPGAASEKHVQPGPGHVWKEPTSSQRPSDGRITDRDGPPRWQ